MWTEALEDLEKHVKDQVPQAKHATHQEKASGEIAPYVVVKIAHNRAVREADRNSLGDVTSRWWKQV